jgi:hypothetical protein
MFSPPQALIEPPKSPADGTAASSPSSPDGASAENRNNEAGNESGKEGSGIRITLHLGPFQNHCAHYQGNWIYLDSSY